MKLKGTVEVCGLELVAASFQRHLRGEYFFGGMRCEQKNHPWDTARFPRQTITEGP